MATWVSMSEAKQLVGMVKQLAMAGDTASQMGHDMHRTVMMKDGLIVDGDLVEEHHQNNGGKNGLWEFSGEIVLQRTDGTRLPIDLMDVKFIGP